MDDDTRFKDLTLPEDEPWMSHGFISKIAAQVSLPYRKPKGGVKEIERRNGSLVLRVRCGLSALWQVPETVRRGAGPCPSGGVRRFRFVSGARV